LQRIAVVADQLGQLDNGPDAEVLTLIRQMLYQHPWREGG